MKIVIDTNVVIAAFASHGLCHLLFESIIAHHNFILSPQLCQEIQLNLKKKIKLHDERVKEIMTFLKTNAAAMLRDRPVSGLRCRDLEDLKILALAVNSGADVIVTGDQDLLVLKSVGSTVIVSPRELWDLLRRSEG